MKKVACVLLATILMILTLPPMAYAEYKGIDPVLNESDFSKDAKPASSADNNTFRQFQYVTNLLWYNPLGNKEMYITSGIGYRKVDGGSTFHHGTDYRANFVPLYAPMGGIAYIGTVSSGKYILIDHENGFYTCFRHLSSFETEIENENGEKTKSNLKNGQRVKTGQLIGKTGDGNGQYAAHLHYELAYYKNGGGINTHTAYYKDKNGGIWSGNNEYGNGTWITLNPAKQNYTTDASLVGDYSNAANTLEFHNIGFPSTYKINDKGWNQVGGFIVSDAKIVEVKSKIVRSSYYDKDGKFVPKEQISATVTPYKPNAKLFSVFKLDNGSKEDNGVKFSYIKDDGNYIWYLTAEDEDGKIRTFLMPFKAVKEGQTKTDDKNSMFESQYEAVYRFIKNSTTKNVPLVDGTSIKKYKTTDLVNITKVVNVYEGDTWVDRWFETTEGTYVHEEDVDLFYYVAENWAAQNKTKVYRANTDTKYWQYPYTGDVDGQSFSLKAGEFSKGDEFTVIKQVSNKYNNTWYQMDNGFFIHYSVCDFVKEVTTTPAEEHNSGREASTITWLNDDGSLIDTTVVDHGKVPTHDAPTKEGYTFSGWTPDVVAVTGPATYQAVFKKADVPADKPTENTNVIEIDLTYQYDAAKYAADLVNAFRTSDTWYWNENNTEKKQVSGLKALTYDKELEKIAMQNAAEAIVRPSGNRPDGTTFNTAYNFTYSAVYPLTFGFRITNPADAASAVREAIKNNIDNLLQETGNYTQQYTRRVMLSNAFKYIGAGCVYVEETNAYYVTLVLISDAGKNGPALSTPARINVSDYNLEHYFSDVSASPVDITMKVGESVNLPVVTAKSTLGFKPTVRIVSASWSASNDAIKISDGKINGQHDGTASLKAAVGSKEVTVNVTVSAESQNPYYTYSGSGQSFVKTSGEDKQFSVKRTAEDEKTFALFTGIQVDGKNVDKNNYEATAGSVVIKLKASYLETLAVGDHVLTVLFSDGKNDIPFTVTAAETPAKPIDPTKFADVAVPSDSFTFKKVWQGDHEDSIDFTLYKADGSVYHHGFDKKVVSKTEWRYNAYFSAPAACYVIEKPVPGYQIKYVNVGVYADITDRCCDGGTIINKKIPKTGDAADFALWAGIIALGIVGLTTTVIIAKRKKAHK